MLRLAIFFIANFAALGLGSYFIGDEITGDWYSNLNQAPWTPPGWFFGVAWTTIMICFSFFMWKISEGINSKNSKILIIVYSLQWILNAFWNYAFFKEHQVIIGLIMITALSLVVLWFLIYGFRNKSKFGYLVLPYFLWLLIATSLNAYFLINN